MTDSDLTVETVKRSVSLDQFEIFNWYQNEIFVLGKYSYDEINKMSIDEFEKILSELNLIKDHA